MRKLIISLDDETYRRARMIAAERNTSVSALVRQHLVDLPCATDKERLKQEERALRDRVTVFRASDRLTRDDMYDRCG